MNTPGISHLLSQGSFLCLALGLSTGAKGSSDPIQALGPSEPEAPAPLLEEAQKHPPPAQRPPSASTGTQPDGRNKRPEFPTPALLSQV